MTKEKREEQLRNRCLCAVVCVGVLICLIPARIVPPELVIESEQIETEYDLIRWKEETETVEEVSIAPVEITTVTDEAEETKEIAFYDVPLSKDLQAHIFNEWN